MTLSCFGEKMTDAQVKLMARHAVKGPKSRTKFYMVYSKEGVEILGQAVNCSPAEALN